MKFSNMHTYVCEVNRPSTALQHGVTGGGSKLDVFFSSSSSSSSASSSSEDQGSRIGVGHTDQLRAAYVATTAGGRRVVRISLAFSKIK